MMTTNSWSDHPMTENWIVDIDQVTVWEMSAPLESLTISTTEMQARCPVTRQTDLYHCEIQTSGVHILESKEFQRYLWSWADEYIGCEQLALTLTEHVSRRLEQHVRVELTQHTRGDLTLRAVAQASGDNER